MNRGVMDTPFGVLLVTAVSLAIQQGFFALGRRVAHWSGVLLHKETLQAREQRAQLGKKAA